MGYYIDRTPAGDVPAQGKAKWLLENVEGTKQVKPEFQPDLVCVVENGFFDAAGYCFDEQEFEDFADPRDRRRKTWLVVPDAAKLSNFNRS